MILPRVADIASEARWAEAIAASDADMAVCQDVPECLQGSRPQLSSAFDVAGTPSFVASLPLCLTSLALLTATVYPSGVAAPMGTWASALRRREGLARGAGQAQGANKRRLELAEVFLVLGTLINMGTPLGWAELTLRLDPLVDDELRAFTAILREPDLVLEGDPLADLPALSGFPWVAPAITAGIGLRMLDTCLLVIADALEEEHYDPRLSSPSSARVQVLRAVYLLLGAKDPGQAACTGAIYDADAFLLRLEARTRSSAK